MKPHVKIYLAYFPEPKCEVCGKYATITSDGIHGLDVHHIERRGMGGSKIADRIQNLMGLCREHHVLYGDKKEWKEWLQKVHNIKLDEVPLPY